MAQHKKRSYEVSIWTLQDEFITVLKPSNVENKGQIEKAKPLIKDDGTREFSFSIPMYLYEGKEKIINPIWYNTQNGNIIEDMRKIKLTFNKDTDVIKTFEFLIIKVTESHEKDQLYCDIECEGLAFHELGKTGYKISLSSDDFYDEDYKWFTKEVDSTGAIIVPNEPHSTLQYWMNKFMDYKPSSGYIDNSKWYYKIEMNWDAYSNTATGVRDSNKIYEDEYVSSWNETETGYTPNQVEVAKEKERLVDLEESNIYNITQELAETFGVFVKYEYEHDENLHIVGRTVIFYNNYMKEDEGYIDLTYPYSTSAITRSRDGKDVTTKMYVRPADDESSASGLVTIMNVEANKSREDYLLNFDYLYSIGGITVEQYADVPIYEKNVGACNRKLEAIEGPLLSLQGRVPELEAAVTLHTNAIQLDKERIDNSNDLLNQLTNGEGTITIDSSSPQTAILLQSTKTDGNNSYYINVTEHGVLTETVKIYRYYNFTLKNFNYPDNYSIVELRGQSSEIKTGTPENDEFGNLIKISSLYKGNNDSSVVYLTFSYVPKLYYDRVKQTWEERLAKDEAELQKSQDELNSVKNKILAYQTEYNNWLRQKKEYVAAFEKMMGPAIRESYWQPDDYHDYGDNYVDAFTFSGNPNTTIPGSSELTELLWDKKPFDDEQLGSYDVTVSQIVTYYPVIDLSGHEEYVKNNLNKLSFMFYDYRNPGLEKTPRNIRNFPVGSLSQYGFAAIGNTVKPVLIITGVESCTQESRIRMTDNTYEPTVGVLTTTIEGSNITTTIAAGSWQPTFLNTGINGNFTAINLVYPRIRIASLALKTSSDMLAITYNNVALKDYEDYYILTRDDTTTEYGDLQYSSSYYITFKPEAMLAQGGIDKAVMIQFNISNADISIYLDAIKVLKENAFPKVSYTIDPSVVDENFSYTLYNQLNRICNINDNDLKFENIQGYISELELDCDNPENDKIEIKNYKTKFEDLFSSIVAQTEAMKKSAYTINLASQAFTSTGTIDADVFKNTVMKVDLNYAFNNGKLIIDEKNGIWGISDSGVVAFRGGGIFTATEKDSNGNWKWNTGIVPQGINADLISSGQLDTNRIKIYAGDRIAFQLNGDGLFAYKSFFSDQTILAAAATHQIISDKINENKQASLDPAQYVVHNQNGLFLVAKAGAYVLNADKSDFIELDHDVTRVEVSWDGFKLRNWDNEQVFWADPDTGNLYIAGTVFADEFGIYKTRDDIDDPTKTPVLLDAYLDARFEDHVKVSEVVKEIFDEAGEIIQDSLKSISAIEAKTLENAAILQGFYDDIKAGLKDDRIIKLYGSSSVDIYSGDITDVSTISVLSLSKDKGVWIGSGKAINLFSGSMPTSGNTATGSSVCIDPTKIMFGVSSTGTATVVEMKKDYIILAAANQLSAIESANESTWTANDATVSGVKITKDGIWLATGTGPARSLISLTPGNVTIGVSPNSGNEGSFIKLTKAQLMIGASTQLYINASNIALDSTNNGSGVGFRLGPAATPKLVFNDGNLSVSGTIYATGLYVGSESTPIDEYIDGRIPDIPEGTHNYYQNSTPSSGYKKGETWFNTSNNVTYMAKRDYVTGATPSDDWEPISVKITGTYLSVDATSGIISISATSTLSIASGNSLNISCAGNIHLYGTGNIYIDSGSNIWVYANSNVSVYGGGNLGFYGGNAISMYTSNGSGGYNTNVSIDNNGILLNGKSLELRTTGGATAVTLNNNSITMNTAGNVTLQGTSGFIQFGTDMNAPAFSVDTEGVVMCRKIICSGEITGILPSSGSGTTTDPYVLYFNESDAQQAYGWYSHSRTSTYRCQTTITPGNYTCDLDWKLICCGSTTLQNAQITVYYRPYSSSTGQIQVYQASVGNWAYGDGKYVNGGTNNVITISSSTQVLNFYTSISYNNSSGTCGTRYDKVYNNLVRLIPQT